MTVQDIMRGVTGAIPGLRTPSDVQSLIGLIKGISQTGSLPREQGDAMVFDTPSSEMPATYGQTVFMPKGSSPETLNHELRHATQAATIPLAPAIGTAAGLMTGPSDLYTNPLEMDAYMSQGASPTTQTDLNVVRAMAKPSPSLTALYALLANMHGVKP